MKKSIFALLICILLILASGCGIFNTLNKGGNANSAPADNGGSNASLGEVQKDPSADNENVLEEADVSKYNLIDIIGDKFSTKIPDTWMIGENALSESVNILVYQKSTYGSGNANNITADISRPYSGKITNEMSEQLLKVLKGMTGYGTDITEGGLYMLKGEPVIYMEKVTKMSDELIDLMIEQGVMTQADLEMYGGREALLAMPESEQIQIYAVVDDNLVLYTATYYDKEDREEILDVMKIMIDNSNVS